MKTEEKRIPFLFVPIPKLFFAEAFFNDKDMFRLIAWACFRTAHASNIFPIGSHPINLENGEFIFGRKSCSEETGISEQRIRTLINRLINQQIVIKLTTKSTNKFSVYKWLWKNFPENCNQQFTTKSTSKSPKNNHNLEDKNIDIRNSKQHGRPSNGFADLLSQFKLNKNTEFALIALPTDEQKAIYELFQRRNNEKTISNPSNWILNCIQKKWHHEKRPIQKDTPTQPYEENRALAKLLSEKLENIGLHTIVSADFIELKSKTAGPWQIFFNETPAAFKEQIESALRKMNLSYLL